TRGFAIVYPEDLEFSKQVQLLHNARFVVAPNGSAIMLAFFAQAGAKLCVLNHPCSVEIIDVTSVLEEIGLDCTILIGPYVKLNDLYPHQSDFEIDENMFQVWLDEWLETPARPGSKTPNQIDKVTLQPEAENVQYELTEFKTALAQSGWPLF